jgi:hypothetical protein
MQLGEGEIVVIAQIGSQVVAMRGPLRSINVRQEVCEMPWLSPWERQFEHTGWSEVQLELFTNQMVVVEGSVSDVWSQASEGAKPYAQPALPPHREALDG